MTATAPRAVSRRRVLVVEDDPSVRHIINRVLGSTYDITEAVDGEAAISHAKHGGFDLLIYDPGLPGDDDSLKGSRLLLRLYAMLMPIRVLVISGGDISEISESGLFVALQKPLTPAPLRNIVDALLASTEIHSAAEVVTPTKPPALRPAWLGFLGFLLVVGALVAKWQTDIPLGIVVAAVFFGIALIWIGPGAGESFTRMAAAISAFFGKK